MKKKILIIVVILLFILVLLPDDGKDKPSDGDGPVDGSPPSDVPVDIPPAVSVQQKGNRLLGLALADGDVGFADTYAAAKAAGIELIEIATGWDDLEPKEGEYKEGFLKIANDYYGSPSENKKLAISLTPIDSNNLRLPSYLKKKDFDDPIVVERFKRLIDYVASLLVDVEVAHFGIGNEIGAYLGTNDKKWKAYTNFIAQVKPYVSEKFPGTIVSVKGQFKDVTGKNKERFIELNKLTDGIFITNYLNVSSFGKGDHVADPKAIHEDFARITSLYPGRKIHYLELGYPTSAHLQSSEAKQAEFVRETFAAWDVHRDAIQTVRFFAINDYSKAQLDVFEDYYGLGSKDFLEFLGTLGFRYADGTEKEAMAVFREEASKRGW